MLKLILAHTLRSSLKQYLKFVGWDFSPSRLPIYTYPASQILSFERECFVSLACYPHNHTIIDFCVIVAHDLCMPLALFHCSVLIAFHVYLYK